MKPPQPLDTTAQQQNPFGWGGMWGGPGCAAAPHCTTLHRILSIRGLAYNPTPGLESVFGAVPSAASTLGFSVGVPKAEEVATAARNEKPDVASLEAEVDEEPNGDVNGAPWKMKPESVLLPVFIVTTAAVVEGTATAGIASANPAGRLALFASVDIVKHYDLSKGYIRRQ